MENYMVRKQLGKWNIGRKKFVITKNLTKELKTYLRNHSLRFKTYILKGVLILYTLMIIISHLILILVQAIPIVINIE